MHTYPVDLLHKVASSLAGAIRVYCVPQRLSKCEKLRRNLKSTYDAHSPMPVAHFDRRNACRLRQQTEGVAAYISHEYTVRVRRAAVPFCARRLRAGSAGRAWHTTALLPGWTISPASIIATGDGALS